MIVLDASVVVEILRATRTGRTLASRLRAADRALAAPELLDVEVLHVFRRLARRADVGAAVALLGDLPIERFGHAVLRPRIWALRENLTPYDAAYVALAEALDAPLWTRDARLRDAPGARVSVELV